MRLSAFFIITLIISCTPKPDAIDISDYDRAVSYMWQNIDGQQAFNLRTRANWSDEGHQLWFKREMEEGYHFYTYDFESASTQLLFDHEKVAQLLSDSADTVNPYELPIDNITINEGSVRIEYNGTTADLSLSDYELTSVEEEESEEDGPFESTSPDGNWVAYTKDYNVYVRSTKTGATKKLSRDGRKGHEYGTWYGWYDIIEGENTDRPEHFYVSWSPDSRYFRTSLINTENASKMYLLDWSIDTLYRPVLQGYYRGSPGDENMVMDYAVVYDVISGREMKPDLGATSHVNTAGVTWISSDRAILNYASRGYQNQYLKILDLKSGRNELLYHESSETNIDNFRFWYLEEQEAVLVASERSGWRQLYMIDLEGKKLQPVTQGEFVVSDLLEYDEETEQIFFMASGKEDGANPYHEQLYSVSFNGENLTLLTTETGQHHQISLSSDLDYFVDNVSSIDQPTLSLLRSAENGDIIDTLNRANVSKLTDKGWQYAETFTNIARDGKTTLYSAIWKPSNFDPGKKYPVIDHSYTGPHTQMYPRDFRRTLTVSNQALAELGFVVVMIDGLGSSGRSKEFHNHSYKNLGGNLEDHVLTIKAMGEKYSWIDTSRVGIFGHSAGGYDAAHGLLAYADFYKVGVASSADHDHRMEKAWWPEMYMGWPVDSAYHLQSNVTMAGNLKGKLLITHGGIDNNVNPSASFKLAEAFVNADKDFDLVIFPSQRHGYRGMSLDYFRKKRWNYFVENLRGVEPIWEFSWEQD